LTQKVLAKKKPISIAACDWIKSLKNKLEILFLNSCFFN
jgi:hypothetical protein